MAFHIKGRVLYLSEITTIAKTHTVRKCKNAHAKGIALQMCSLFPWVGAGCERYEHKVPYIAQMTHTFYRVVS